MAYYSWILAFHVMSFISWMAALFYLPRLYVYHREHADNDDFVKVVKIQEYKLLKYIGVPAMWATILSGLTMLWLNPALFHSGVWMHIKLTAVFILFFYQIWLARLQLKLGVDPHYKSGKFFRVINEAPTLLMIVIVIMVVVKPV